MRYKDSEKPLPQIARELNVEGVVEGSVLRVGERIRITAQLIHAGTDTHLWAKNYERDFSDVLALQRELATAIAQEIQVKLTPQEESLLAREGTVNPIAHDAYLKGLFFARKRSPKDFERAIEQFQKAVQADPEHARAYAQMSYVYTVQGFNGFKPLRSAVPEARAAALKAMQINDTLAEGHTSLGWVLHYYDWDWEAAGAAFRKAIELNPGYAMAHQGYSQHLGTMGRQTEAMEEIQKALELDPLSLIINHNVAVGYIGLGRYDEAMDQLMKTLELEPDYFQAHEALSVLYWRKGMYEEAFTEAKTTALLMGYPEVAKAMERGYELSGFKGAMGEGARKAAEQWEHHYVAPVHIAILYSLAEEDEQALQWLERAYRDRDPMILVIKGALRLERLRSHPRFQDLIRRLNLPE